MKHLTIRDVPQDLARALEKEKRRRGQSLNETVKQLLRRSLSLEVRGPYSNGLARLAGSWTEEDLVGFEKETAGFEAVD